MVAGSRATRIALLAVTALVVAPAGARADDRALLRAAGTVAAVHDAFTAARSAPPAGLQLAYDRARDLQEAVRRAGRPSPSCRSLATALRSYAASVVTYAEGLDRPLPALATRGSQAAQAWRIEVPAAIGACRPAAAPGRATVPPLAEPRPGEAFFGTVRGAAPAAARTADVIVAGRVVASTGVSGGMATARLDRAPGRLTVELRFRAADGRLLGRRRSAGVWLLPQSARVSAPAESLDGAAAARVSRLVAGFGGYAGVWAADLRTGAVAQANATAAFPAASTVKLGVLLEGLRRARAPESATIAHDLRAIAAWSSNLAANRLLRLLGGRAAVEEALRRAGATASTYPGEYRPGTSVRGRWTLFGAGVGHLAILGTPPRVSSRVTTAQDLGRVLWSLHAAATGDAAVLRRLGLSAHQARVGLALLLDCEPVRDNVGLFREALPPGTPLAHKNGWIRAVRHDAAIVYGASGPRIVVLLTYRDAGLDRRTAARLGAAVLAAGAPRG